MSSWLPGTTCIQRTSTAFRLANDSEPASLSDKLVIGLNNPARVSNNTCGGIWQGANVVDWGLRSTTVVIE
jgi:hypothetical protein